MDMVTTSKSVSFWKKPERLFTVVALGGLALVAGHFVLPLLAGIVWAGFNLMIGCAALGVAGILLFNKRLWKSIFYLSDIFGKNVLGLILELDPFVIADENIQKMKKNRELFFEQSVVVDKQKHLLNKKIEERYRNIEKEHNRAIAAEQNNMQEAKGVAIRQKERLERGLEKQIPLRDNLANFSTKLTDLHRKIGYEIEDQENELSDFKDLFNSLQAGANALSTVKKIFNGDPDDAMELAESMNFLNDRMAHNLASMEKDYSLVTSMTEKTDLDNAVFEMKGLAKLENSNLLKLKERVKEPVRVASDRKLGTVDRSNQGPLYKSKNMLDD